MFAALKILEIMVKRGGQFDCISAIVEDTGLSKYLVRKALKELQIKNLVWRHGNKFYATTWGERLINSQDSNFAVTPYEYL